MTEERKCYRKGGRRPQEPQWAGEAEPVCLTSKRAKQFAAFRSLRGYEEMLEEVRSSVDGAAQSQENNL